MDLKGRTAHSHAFWLAPKGKPLILFAFLILGSACEGGPRSETVTVRVREGTELVASLSPDGETVAFILLGKIWALSREGGNAVPLTDPMEDLNEYSSIAWDPDSRRLATTTLGDEPGIYVVDVLSKKLQQVSERFDVQEPTWAADGNSLLGASVPPGMVPDPAGLWRIPLDGEEEQEYLAELHGFGGMVTCAPSEGVSALVKPVTYQGPDWRSDLWEVDPVTGDQRQLTADSVMDAYPAYSPDGRWIAFISERSGTRQVWLLSREDGEARQLTEAENVYLGHLSWLPDSRGVVYTGAGKIWVAPLDGPPPAAIEFVAELPVRRWTGLRRPELPEPGERKRVLGMVTPQLSPDGTRVAFAALGDLWIAEVAGGAPRRLTETIADEYNPRWSPDGNRLLYQAQPVAEAPQARLLEVDGTGDFLTLDLPQVDLEHQFAWSPDGHRIAYAANNVVGWVFADGAPGQVVAQGAGTLVGWSADGDWIVYSTGQYETQFRFSHHLWRVSAADSGRVEPWPVPQEYLLRGGWTSDLTRAAYVESGHGYHVLVAGTEAPTPLADPSPRYFSWSSDGRYLLYLSESRLRLHDTERGETRTLEVSPTFVVPSAPPPLLVRNVMIIDGKAQPPTGPFDVLLRGGRIERVGQPGKVRPQGEVEEIEGEGHTLLPGLFDTHTHRQFEFSSRSAGYLYNGVLSVRDVGTVGEWQQAQRERIESGELLAPRYFMSGGMVQREIHGASMTGMAGMYTRELDPADTVSVLGELRSLRSIGADIVKIRIRDASLDARVAEASHQAGLPVTSHYAFPSTLARGLEGKEHSHLYYRGWTSPYMEDMVSLLQAGDVCVTPTLMTYYVVSLHGTSALFPVDLSQEPPHASLLSRQSLEWTRQFLGFPLSDRSWSSWETRFGWDLANVRRLHEAGVRITTGTDTPSPWAELIQLEIEALVEAGLTPLEAIRAATYDAASCVGVEQELGSVEEGKLADLIIVEGDPASNIGDLRRVVWIIRGGKPYTRADIADWVEEHSG